MVLVMILFIYVSVMRNRISVMTPTLQKTMCFHHHGSGYDFIHIRVCYAEPYHCHDINITEDNVFSSSWFWLWFYSYTCLLCGTVSVSWHQHNRRQCVVIIMVLVMILFIYVSVMWDRISVMTSTLQKTVCFHHHGSGYEFIYIRALLSYEDVSTWKCFSQHWLFAMGIHRSTADTLCKGQSC